MLAVAADLHVTLQADVKDLACAEGVGVGPGRGEHTVTPHSHTTVWPQHTVTAQGHSPQSHHSVVTAHRHSTGSQSTVTPHTCAAQA